MQKILFSLLCPVLALNAGCANGACSCDKNSSCCNSGCCKPNCCAPNCCKPTGKPIMQGDKDKEVRETIKDAYSQVAQGGGCCDLFGGGCCGGGKDLSEYIGYSKEELQALESANLGLGCGNPVGLGEFKDGFTVLDLGSGAGLDCFLAAKKVGETGFVIGVDMTPEMIKKANENALKYGIKNVEFRLGFIENLPVKSNSVDIIMSNCVINLSTNKSKVFEEAYRVLKHGGKMYVSDVVLTGELSDVQKRDVGLLCACVSGALPKDEYMAKIIKVGFELNIVGEDKEINQKWFNSSDLPISSLKFIAIKK